MQRQYYRVEKAGSLSGMMLRNGKIFEVTEGQVLVEVKAVGLNYADLFAIMGLYSATPKGSFTPGLEYAGVVLESKVESFQVGQRVIGLTKFGGYNSHIVADPDYLIDLPDDWSYEEGAAFPVQTLTAYYALHTLGALQQGQTVLIHSAAGGVGLQANRIAKKFDAYTIGVVGSDKKLPLLAEEGYDASIVRNRAFQKSLNDALRGRELNLVLEASGGKYFKYSYQALAPMGRLVAYGSAQFTPSGVRPNYLVLALKYIFRPRVDPLSMISANKSVMAFNLIWLYERHSLMKALLDGINQLRLPPPRVGQTFPFEKASDALMLFKSGQTTGKVVLTL